MITIDISDVLIICAIAVPVGFLNNWIAIWGYKRRLRKREERFLKVVKIDHPGSTITLISADSSDEATMKKLEEQYREGR